MQEFNDCCQIDMFVTPVTQGTAAKQHQHWPHALSTGFNNVMTNAFNQWHTGIQLGNDFFVESGEIIRHDLMYVFDHDPSRN